MLLLALLGFFFAGCQSITAPSDVTGVYDPLEGLNRRAFRTYLVFDRHAFRPAATAYRTILPPPVRRSARNFLNNLDSPRVFANDVLRGRARFAGITVLRAAINSTLGIGGLFDVAQELQLNPHSDDFGKTLAVYDVKPGPYLFLVPLGPSNVRDFTGWVVDFFLNPFLFMGWNGKYFAVTGQFILSAIDTRASNVETLDDIERSSTDYYAALRSAYTQARNREIRQELGEEEELPDF